MTITRTKDSSQIAPTGSVTVAENDALTGHNASTINATTNQQLTNVVVGTFTETDTTTTIADLAATIKWGDGTTTAGTVTGSNGSFTVTGTHTYTAAGQDTISVSLADDGTGTAVGTAQTTANVTSGALAGSVVLAQATEHVALASSTTVATFTDSDTTDTAGGFTASINWGDGITTNGTVTGSNGSFSVTGGHTVIAQPPAAASN